MIKKDFKHEIEALEAKRAFDLTNKEMMDSKDFKRILILMSCAAIGMVVYFAYVIICL